MIARIEARALGISRNGAPILADVSFAAGAGEFIALVGPNGAGKSTLLRALAGLEAPASGAALIDGEAAFRLSSLQRARALAFLPQAREVHWAITTEAVVALGRFAYGALQRLGPEDRAAVGRAIAATDIGALRGRVAKTLSGGESARMHLARALAAEAPILLADEPTAALDLRHALGVIEILKDKAAAGGLVVAAIHDLDLAARAASRLIVLDRGRLVADGPPQTTLTPTLASSVFGVAMEECAGLRYRLP